MDKIVVHNKLVLHSKRADYLEVFLPILSIFIVSSVAAHMMMWLGVAQIGNQPNKANNHKPKQQNRKASPE